MGIAYRTGRWAGVSTAMTLALALLASVTPSLAADPPEGVPDGPYPVSRGTTIEIPAPGVLANDQGVGLEAELEAPALHGWVTLRPDGSFSYTHEGSETRVDRFTYRAVSSAGESQPTVVSLDITPAVAQDDGPYDVFGGVFTLPPPGVLANDADPWGGGLTAILLSDTRHGDLLFRSNGSFSYRHDGSASPTDSFTYQARDAIGVVTTVATVTLRIIHPDVVTLMDPDSATWYVQDMDGGVSTSFAFGDPADVPVLGDWDGDGIDSPGVLRPGEGRFYLTNDPSGGTAETAFTIGDPGDVPLAGDFDGDGLDSVSVYRPATQTVHIFNRLGEPGSPLGIADHVFLFGNPGDEPFVGDFDGDGFDTIGVHRPSSGETFLRNTLTSGVADVDLVFGNPDDIMIFGDWNGTLVSMPGVHRRDTRTMFLRSSLTSGVADERFSTVASDPAWIPLAGSPVG